MADERASRFGSNIQHCASWRELIEAFEELPKPALQIDEAGEVHPEGWIYRGHQSDTYRLEPSIERECLSNEWAEMEYRMLQEFRAKAPMHLTPAELPPPDCKFSWLAIMRHRGAPTRLLDFTYSPYVALYFALRHRNHTGRHAEVWGMDSAAILRQAGKIISQVDNKRDPATQPRVVSLFDLTAMSSALQSAQANDLDWDNAIRDALNPSGPQREHYNNAGLIVVASPPTHNLRLSSQQGVFIFNGAEDHCLEESLELMMRGVDKQWYKRFRIPEAELRKIEGELFQMNIHDLSLFPDAEGLAGFVRQRMRLHW